MPNGDQVTLTDWRDVVADIEPGTHTPKVFGLSCERVLLCGVLVRRKFDFIPTEANKCGPEGTLRIEMGNTSTFIEGPLDYFSSMPYWQSYAHLARKVRLLLTTLGVDILKDEHGKLGPTERMAADRAYVLPEGCRGLSVEAGGPPRSEAAIRLVLSELRADPRWQQIAVPGVVGQDSTFRVILRDVPDWCKPVITLYGIGAFPAV